MLRKARNAISRIFSLCSWQLGLDRELGAMAVFLVPALTPFESPVELWHCLHWETLILGGIGGGALILCLCVLKACQVVLWVTRVVGALASRPLACGERESLLPSALSCPRPFLRRNYARCLHASALWSSQQVWGCRVVAPFYRWENGGFRELKSLGLPVSDRDRIWTCFPFKCLTLLLSDFPWPSPSV